MITHIVGGLITVLFLAMSTAIVFAIQNNARLISELEKSKNKTEELLMKCMGGK